MGRSVSCSTQVLNLVKVERDPTSSAVLATSQWLRKSEMREI